MSGIQQPTITILIPAFDRERFIRTAIESALRQTTPADEIIVVDDGSTDRTAEIARSFGAAVRVISIENDGSGPSRPRNIGIRAAKSSHIMFLDSDDRLEATAIARCRDVYRRHPKVGLVCGNYFIVSDGENIENRRILNDATTVHQLESRSIGNNEFYIRQQVAYAAFCRWNFIKMNASTVPKEICTKLNGFDEDLRTANDYDFFMRILSHHDMVYIDEPMQTIVRHGENISSANLHCGFREHHALNYLTVLKRQLKQECDRSYRPLLLTSIQDWILELAFGYRESGQFLRAVLCYARYVYYGGNLARASRGLAGIIARGLRIQSSRVRTADNFGNPS